MLRRAFYCAMYPNNFIYIEEYCIGVVTIVLALTFSITVSAVFLLLSPFLLSPRFVINRGNNNKALCEDPNATRPNTGLFSVCNRRGLVDVMDRRVYLRGVNIGGKQPLGHTTWTQPPRKGSFIGTLFEMDSIDSHLHRLASCGFTLLRLNITWEALEPIAEGYYDMAYIAYLVSVVRACDRHGMWVVIDSHQDAWSRWTGGDGAPRWTMERLGMDPGMFTETRSAMLHGEDSGHMTWFVNYTLYGAGTMFALFFGGNRFAPATKVNGVGVQEWLQSAYIRAWCKVAEALAGERNVLGFEPMNEPNAGWIGVPDLRKHPLPAFMGWDITPWDSIRLANGDSVDVASFALVNAYQGTQSANPDGSSVWKRTYTDVWKENGIWGEDEGLMKPEHFRLEGESFEADFLTPFHRRFANSILSYNPSWWIVCFPKLEGIPTAVSSPHWYDNITLVMNRYIPYLAISVDNSCIYPVHAPYAHRKALESIKPFFLGEVGVPWLGTVQSTSYAMESTMVAVDACFIPALTMWNYNPHHTEEKGDGWNLEDFSIWSPDSSSFRMPTAVRPYVMALAGSPVSVKWDPFGSVKTFTLEFDAVDARSNVSLIFVPEMHYRTGVKVWTSDNGEVTHDKRQQTIEYRHKHKGGRKMVRITCRRGLSD